MPKAATAVSGAERIPSSGPLRSKESRKQLQLGNAWRIGSSNSTRRHQVKSQSTFAHRRQCCWRRRLRGFCPVDVMLCALEKKSGWSLGLPPVLGSDCKAGLGWMPGHTHAAWAGQTCQEVVDYLPVALVPQLRSPSPRLATWSRFEGLLLGKNVSSFSFLWSAGFDLLLRGLEQSHSQSSLPLPRSWLKFPSRPTSSAAHLSYRFHGQCIRHSMQWSNEYVVLQLPRLLETVAGGPEEVKIN